MLSVDNDEFAALCGHILRVLHSRTAPAGSGSAFVGEIAEVCHGADKQDIERAVRTLDEEGYHIQYDSYADEVAVTNRDEVQNEYEKLFSEVYRYSN